MNRVDVSSSEWAIVIEGENIDYIIECKNPVLLAFGDDPGDDNFGISASEGYQLIVPSGLSVWARARGSASASIVTGPFGVNA